MWQPVPGLESLGLPFVSVLVQLDEAGGNRLMGTLSGSGDGPKLGAAVTGEVVERTLNGVTRSILTWRLT